MCCVPTSLPTQPFGDTLFYVNTNSKTQRQSSSYQYQTFELLEEPMYRVNNSLRTLDKDP
jgi:hypothetical protein